MGLGGSGAAPEAEAVWTWAGGALAHSERSLTLRASVNTHFQVRFALLEDEDLASMVAELRDKVNEAVNRAAHHFEVVVGSGESEGEGEGGEEEEAEAEQDEEGEEDEEDE